MVNLVDILDLIELDVVEQEERDHPNVQTEHDDSDTVPADVAAHLVEELLEPSVQQVNVEVGELHVGEGRTEVVGVGGASNVPILARERSVVFDRRRLNIAIYITLLLYYYKLRICTR